MYQRISFLYCAEYRLRKASSRSISVKVRDRMCCSNLPIFNPSMVISYDLIIRKYKQVVKRGVATTKNQPSPPLFCTTIPPTKRSVEHQRIGKGLRHQPHHRLQIQSPFGSIKERSGLFRSVLSILWMFTYSLQRIKVPSARSIFTNDSVVMFSAFVSVSPRSIWSEQPKVVM